MGDIEKRDVAVFGLWWSWNYGSIMTYYALYRTIKDLGYSVTMIDRPGFKPDAPIYHSHGRGLRRNIMKRLLRYLALAKCGS